MTTEQTKAIQELKKIINHAPHYITLCTKLQLGYRIQITCKVKLKLQLSWNQSLKEIPKRATKNKEQIPLNHRLTVTL